MVDPWRPPASDCGSDAATTTPGSDPKFGAQVLSSTAGAERDLAFDPAENGSHVGGADRSFFALRPQPQIFRNGAAGNEPVAPVQHHCFAPHCKLVYLTDDRTVEFLDPETQK
jgi:hypothetical protein